MRIRVIASFLAVVVGAGVVSGRDCPTVSRSFEEVKASEVLIAPPSLPFLNATRWDLRRGKASSSHVVAACEPPTVAFPLRLGTSRTVSFASSEGVRPATSAQRVVGRGWLLLPKRPVLATLVEERVSDDTAAHPRLQYRWLNEKAGTVALLIMPNEGRGFGDARLLRLRGDEEGLIQDLYIYSDEVAQAPYTSIGLTFPLGERDINTLTPDAFPNAGSLASAASWDFSALSAADTAYSTQVPINSTETCHAGRCGFTLPSNDYLLRIDNPGSRKTVSAMDFDGTNTTYTRALVSNEGTADELRVCLDGNGHTTMPLYTFPNQDAGGYFMKMGDSWASGVFDCEMSAWATLGSGCDDGLGAKLDNQNGHEGRYSSSIVNQGTVTLPSGHILNALVVRSLLDASTHDPLLPCFSFNIVQEVRTYVYSWVVPHLGVAFAVNSQQNEPSPTDWTHATGATVTYGHLPPVALNVASEGFDRITITVDPGNHAGYIGRFKAYWDTDAGAPYAFDSDTNAGQVQWSGTSATITGLACDTAYFATVSSLTTYTDPDSGIATEYESLPLPNQIIGDPDHAYPTEIAAQTHCGCMPVTEVRNLYLVKAGADVAYFWDAVTGDPCVDHFNLHGSDVKDSWMGFEPNVAYSGPVNSFQGNAAFAYYLVVAMGPNSEPGPVGHYGR